MLKHMLSVLAFMVVTFTVQGLSHFVVNKAHFDAIGFARTDPIMPLGFLVMATQGLILSLALTAWRGKTVAFADGLAISVAFGIFLVSYIALTEPAKYAVPSIPSWILIEGVAGLIQFGVYGLLLWQIHKRFASVVPAAA